MKILTLHLLLIFSLLSFSSSAQKLTPTLLKQLDKMEFAMFNAVSNADTTAFKKLSGTDYYSINADGVGVHMNKAIKNMYRFKGSAVKLTNQAQKIYGNFVLRNGRAMFYFGGQPVAEVLYTTGWVYRANRWQYVHWQGTFTGMSLPNTPTPPLPASPSDNDSATKAYLIQLDKKIQEAVVIGDTALLDNVLADDFLFTHGFMKGGQEDRKQWRSLATRQPSFYFYRKVDSSLVELHGDIALVMGTLTIKRGPIVRKDEKDNYCYTLGYVHLYALRNNRWEFLSHRTTRMLTESAPCE